MKERIKQLWSHLFLDHFLLLLGNGQEDGCCVFGLFLSCSKILGSNLMLWSAVSPQMATSSSSGHQIEVGPRARTCGLKSKFALSVLFLGVQMLSLLLLFSWFQGHLSLVSGTISHWILKAWAVGTPSMTSKWGDRAKENPYNAMPPQQGTSHTCIIRQRHIKGEDPDTYFFSIICVHVSVQKFLYKSL